MKMINNADFKSRMKQVLVLILIILLGILISQVVDAQNFQRANTKHFKKKYKSQIKWGSKACHLLAKKREATPSKPVFAFLKSKPKYKPMAEVDQPAWLTNKPVIASNSKREALVAQGR